jgi:hypothetical protein
LVLSLLGQAQVRVAQEQVALQHEAQAESAQSVLKPEQQEQLAPPQFEN